MVGNIKRISQPESLSSFQEHISDTLDNRCLLTLSNVEDLQQVPIALPQVQNIAENFVDKFLQLVQGGDDGGVGISEWFEEDGFDYVDILKVLLLFSDQFMDDTSRPDQHMRCAE